MRPNVYRQGTSLNKAFDAIGVTAMIWSFVSVNPIVSLKIGFAIEALFQRAS